MTRDALPNDPEAGFSLVELLVALAITSFLVIAVGGLIRLSADARGRIEEAGRVEAALLDLRAISEALAGPKGPSIIRFDDSGFDLFAPPAQPSNGATMTARLAGTSGAMSIVLDELASHRRSSVQLGAFETASLEYLDASGPDYVWQSAAAAGRSPAGVRLALSRGARVWRVLLWIGPDQ